MTVWCRTTKPKLPLQIDLYTNGAEGSPGPDGFVTMEDTAVDDMTDFVDYLESPYVIHWCDRINATIVVNGPVQQLTGLVTDTDYQSAQWWNWSFAMSIRRWATPASRGKAASSTPESRTLQAKPGNPRYTWSRRKHRGRFRTRLHHPG